jgi:citrate lyase subunit beta/citryl-CoA lyase
VKPDDKDAARAAAVEAAETDWPMPLAIRVNGVGSHWHFADIDAVAHSKASLAVLPRAASAHLVQGVREAVGKPLMAMIETAVGVLAAAEIARECAALIAGTNDLRADLGVPIDGDRSPVSASLQMIVLAARASAIPAFDGVFNDLENADAFAAECEVGRRLGFTGKSLIHPRQIDACNLAFSPSQAELARARRLVEAFGGGAERFEGQMIERMHVDAARQLLARAESPS